MQKVKFTDRFGRLVGHIAGIPCLLKDGGRLPRAGETWLVEITGTDAGKTHAYVRAVRPWNGTPEDHRAVEHGRVDFRHGTVRLANRFDFPVEHTLYGQLWRDYQVLTHNMNAVIIRGDKAIRWRKTGKPPQVLPLRRFATKYRRQPLLGEPNDIRRFLANLEDFRRETIEGARNQKGEDALSR